MTKLSVNVNKIATLRNSRGKNLPNLLKMTLDIIKFGAGGITIHPRPDERHIKKQDVYDLAANIDVELNIEGYPSEDFMQLIAEVRPAQCTLVPDPPHVLTSNAGWNIKQTFETLLPIINKLRNLNVRSSIFIDPTDIDNESLDLLAKLKCDRVELYTEAYADDFGTVQQQQTLDLYKIIADKIYNLGIEINAGHDLNLQNLPSFINNIPFIKEVSIGHALIADALYYGLSETITKYKNALNNN
jgi:pyridoxine 5-phosphate synthase